MNYQNRNMNYHRSNQFSGRNISNNYHPYGGSHHPYREPSCYQLIQDVTKSIYKITEDISDIKKYIFDYMNNNGNNDNININNNNDMFDYSDSPDYLNSFEDVDFDFLNYSDDSNYSTFNV